MDEKNAIRQDELKLQNFTITYPEFAIKNVWMQLKHALNNEGKIILYEAVDNLEKDKEELHQI